MPIIKEPNSPVTKYIYNQVFNQNRDFRILCTGQVGTGKSFSSLRIAEIFDPTFDVKKQVIFTKGEFNDALEHFKGIRKEILESDLTKAQKDKALIEKIRGKVLIIDEGGVVADNTKWNDKDVKDIKYNLQSIRYLGLILIFNLPVSSHFLKAGRELMDMYIETARPPSVHERLSYMKVYLHKKNLFTKTGRELKKFAFRNEYGFHEEISIWKLKKPSRKYWQPYERYSHMRKDQIAVENNTKELELTIEGKHIQNLVLYLYDNKILSIKEIASVLKCNESKVRKYKTEAQIALKKLYNLKKNFTIY